MLGVCLTRQTPNKPLFGICSGLPQSRMSRSHSCTDVDIPLHDTVRNGVALCCYITYLYPAVCATRVMQDTQKLPPLYPVTTDQDYLHRNL